MKRIILFFAASILFSSGISYAQICGCAAPLGDYGSISVAGWTVGQTASITTCQWGGERSVINNTVAGAVYRVSTCGASYDTQIEIFTTGCTWIAYNDDNGPACSGLNASVDFTSPGGNLYSRMSQFNCATNNSVCVNVTITLLSLPPCASDVTPPSFSGAGGIDQQALTNNAYMAAFSQTDLAQSFIPTQNTSCGASILLNPTGANVGNITIGLYTNLPNLGGTLLASGTAMGVADGAWANVTWPSVSVTPGVTYYLVFTSSNNAQGITGDINNGYPSGQVYANAGYGSFPTFDYTFKEFSCGGGGCPSNIVLNAPSGSCTATATYATPTATDNCSATTVNQTSGLASGASYPYGVTTNTFVASDANGNSATCTFTVTVNDVTAPVANVTSLPTITGQCNASVTAPTATDNCAGTVTGTTSDPTSYSSQGTYTVTWTYNDGHGNLTTQTQSVVVDDVTAPVPNVSSLSTVTGQCNATVSTPTAADNCAGTVTATTSDPTSYSTQGTYTITWTYNDGNGNTSTQTQTVIVDDNVAPVPNTSSLPAMSDPCSVTLTTPSATDNCAGTIAAATTDPTSYTNQGTYTVTWTYNDGNGNTVTQTQNVTITDNVAPVPNVSSLPAVSGQCNVSVSAPSATDNCAGTVNGTTSDPTSYSVQGSYTVTWTYDDGHGNTTTQTQTVIVTDSTAPIPDNSSLPTVNASCNTVLTAPTATDNCSGTVTATTTDPTTYVTQGTFTVTWVYDDGNGNSTSQIQTIIIDDNTAPVPSVPVLPAVTGSCGVTVPAPFANDNCNGTIIGTTTDPLTYNAVGTYTITWTYNDGNGNSSTQSQSVIVNDNSDPVPNDANIDTSAVCTITLIAPTATDACEGTITATTSSPLTYGPGTHVVTWIYDDGNGNIFTQIQNVTVSGCAGIDEYGDNNISLYPNPSNGVFTLSLEHSIGDNVQVQLMNVQGQVLYTGILSAQIQQFDFSELAAGTYYLRLITNTDVYTKSVIIKQNK